MSEFDLTIILAGVVAGAAPVLLATLGETLTERSGIINLSLDGTLLLSAMTGFAAALTTGSILAGFAAAAAVGAATAAVVAVFAIRLGLAQVAVGFVLTLMARDLAYVLGGPFARVEGPLVGLAPIPVLSGLPFMGPMLFNQSLPVYFSMAMIFAVWWYLYRTPPGLKLRCVGENPDGAYARGIDPDRTQLIHAVAGGALVGIAGAAFSLCIKPGWGQPQGCEGAGWIALALVIFGGWHPFKVALGAYLFAFLQVMSIHLQAWFPDVPAQVFQAAPFPLMIFILVLISLAQRESVLRLAQEHPVLKALVNALTGAAPAALGRQRKSDS
ncbi:MAG TPA: ABC transporter permease [Deltaproteobacteria bacterium]|jgi:simple sugar transport system permease protein|nr:ABC transporter permease [Deltaproteobacteria bacterium]HOI06320.1 ABC transporter permease [Deltaproteobacteria bacterium]